MRLLEGAPVIVFLLVATAVEVSGDAVIRRALEDHVGLGRLGLIVLGGLLLLAYGVTINLAPVSFARVAALYVATLFVMWQVITTITFRTVPTAPIIVGGSLIVLRGLIVTYWGESSS